ncbi:MAG: serine/threonine protein kinase [Deltaproteobacteria bacterium]|nr:serine/threonine protein kinase [Deltaproteobacteria bacterium]
MSDQRPASETIAELEARWTALGLVPEDLAPQSNGTIAERPRSASTTVAAPGAPALASSPSPVAAPDAIVLGPVLGVGGMGAVHVAEQPALRREVAVKLLLPERKSAAASTALLQEAWVMGTLEHPNIVPVHLLLREDDGSPRVVMKRIEGVAWDNVIERPELAQQLGGGADVARDPLEFHLRVLIAVCHAIHFAHSRGILHLDLKPDNVMIGRFGEVAVVDWGIAAGHGERAPRWLPAARAIRGVRGTPAWMAPELALADAERIGPTTDVYLLGGMLHAILTRQVRHDAETVRDTLAQAFESKPHPYPPDVPAELATLANRACARDPGARPASADAFRQAIEDFLSHRSATLLAAEAQRRLGPLLERLALRDPTAEDSKADQSIRRQFLECQFAFAQALEIWPENPEARAGLQRLLRAMAEYALHHRQIERAAECLHALVPSDPELSRRLAELARETLEDHARLKALERDADPNVHYRQRGLMALATGLLFIVWNVVVGWLHRSGTLPIGLDGLVVLNTLTLGVFFVAAFAVRKTLLTTASNQRLVVLFGSGFATVLVYWIGAWTLSTVRPELGLDTLDVVSTSSWVYIYFVLAITFTMDRRVAWLAPGTVAFGTLAPLFREHAFEVLGLGGLFAGAGLFVIWRTPARRPAARASGDAPR